MSIHQFRPPKKQNQDQRPDLSRKGGGREPNREPPHHEPMFNIEDPAPFIMAALLLLCHLAFQFSPQSFREFASIAGVLAADQGDVWITDRPLGNIATLLTHVLFHAGWGHVLMNTAFILIFGVISIRGVDHKNHLYFGRFRKGALVFLMIFLLGAIGGGLGQWAQWILGNDTGAALGASTGGAALFAGAAWVIGGRKYLFSFGVVLVLLDVFNIAMGSPTSWAGHIGGYLTGAALAVLVLNPKSVAIGPGTDQVG